MASLPVESRAIRRRHGGGVIEPVTASVKETR
jgi:hypothetical protein